MRKIQAAFVGMFIVGVLLTGVGVGVALIEYSSLQYGGEKLRSGDTLDTKVLEFQMPEDGSRIVLGELQRADLNRVSELVEDPAVPEGVLRYEVTYNPSLVEPYLYFEEYEPVEVPEEPVKTELTNEEEPPSDTDTRIENAEETEREAVPAGNLRLCLDYAGDDFKIFMENKDMILQDLKAGVISSYRSVYVTEIKIQVHPKTRKYLEEAFTIY